MAVEKIPVYRDERTQRGNNRSRKLLFLLFLFFITILIILFFNSTLSKITSIEIIGNHYVSNETIQELSEVQLNDQFFLVLPDRIVNKLKTVPEISGVEVSKKFPGKLIISVTEYPEAALELVQGTSLMVVLANGTNVPLTNHDRAVHLPVLRNWEQYPELRLKLARTLAAIPSYLLADISEIHPYPSVSYPEKLKMYTRSKFEVVSTISYLPDKLPLLDNMIFNMRQTGSAEGEIVMLEANSFEAFTEMSEADTTSE